MDFEDWLREQLSGHLATGPSSERHGRRLPVLGGPHSTLLLSTVGVVLSAALFAAGTGFADTNTPVATVAVAPALPVTTWAGTPPAPSPLSQADPERNDSGLAPPSHAGDPPAAAVPPTSSGRDIAAVRQPPAAPPNAPAAPAPGPRTFSLVGGTATVSCSGGAPSPVSATPRAGFQVEVETEDGGAVLDVRFRSSTHDSRLDASCTGTTVQGQIEESGS